jgi:hypothetical protein
MERSMPIRDRAHQPYLGTRPVETPFWFKPMRRNATCKAAAVLSRYFVITRGLVLMARSRSTRARRSERSGQSLAEFAIVFPVLFLIIAGIIQFGIIFWGQNTLNQVARDTGRWAATLQACTPGAEASVVATANDVASASSLIGYSTAWTASDVTVSFSGSPCPPNDNTQVAWVTITIEHTVPIFFPLVPGNGQISSSTQFRMEPAP